MVIKPIVEVAGFGKRYRKHTVIDKLDLNVNAGEIFGLIGPDGCGKSSVMKAIAGVMTFDAGNISVFGIDLDSEASAEKIKHRTGFMPQGLGLSLYPELSIAENIDFFARLRAVPRDTLKRRKNRLLDITRLHKFRTRAVKNLSGGMKQKLGLICTLIHQPELLILDEPTTGVDPVSRRDFWLILNELVQERSMSVLATTAYLDEASRFHRIALMHKGQILAQGTPNAVNKLVPGHIVMLKAPDQVDTHQRLSASFSNLTPQGPWLRVFAQSDSADHAKQRIAEHIDLATMDDIQILEPELEDTFIALLEREGSATGQQQHRLPDTGARHNKAAVDRELHVVEAKALGKNFGEFCAASDVSFDIHSGEIFGLLGSNGAGKTTVIKMLTGIMTPSSGSGHVAGADLRFAGPEIKRNIGYMSQLFSLYTELTVKENIHLYAGIYGLSFKQGRERARWIIDMAGLDKYLNRRTGSLSMGMRQRLALGCALVHSPRVLFLDEPTSGVDPIGRQQFWDVLFELSRQDGVAVLATTHYMSEAEHCDRLALMHAGKVVVQASPQKMKQDVEDRTGCVLEISSDNPAAAFNQLRSTAFGPPNQFGSRLRVLSRNTEADSRDIVQLLGANGISAAVEPRQLSMEDVFVHWVTQLEAGATETRGA